MVSNWENTAKCGEASWDEGGEGHEVYPLFCEMAELAPDNRGRDQWRETARWVKYEEDVEQGGQRWSKPFVSTVSLQALYTVQELLTNQVVLLDLAADSLERTCGLIVDQWAMAGILLESERQKVLQTLLRRHVHLYEIPSSYTTIKIQPSCLTTQDKKNQRKLNRKPSDFYRRQSTTSMVLRAEPEKDPNKKNKQFMRKIPQDSESANIFVGEMNLLKKPIAAFVRLREARVLGNMTEVPLPTRFIFVVLGPHGDLKYSEVGRAVGTLMSDQKFKEVAYQAETREGLLDGVNNFIRSTTVLPPSGWDPTTRIEPHAFDQHSNSDGECTDDDDQVDNGLTRTGKFFGGFINDLKRKLPWYPSDYKDAFSLQVLATWMFLYFACLTPMITFGGLMGIATHNNMGTMETMVSGCLCGIIFALFSGQPLIILGSTGPVLVFEKILVHFCESNDLSYLEFRLWVGIWIGITLLIFVATDASAFVSYITRFTEENFATLVACIFMVEAVKNVMLIRKAPLDALYLSNHIEDSNVSDLTITMENLTKSFSWDYEIDSDDTETSTDSFGLVNINDSLIEGIQSSTMNFMESPAEADKHLSIFYLSLLLFFGTFLLSYMLKEFRNSNFFPKFVRDLVSDFAVVIAIVGMSAIDMMAGVDTPKLVVPREFAPTLPHRGWLISPFGKNPFWSVFAAILPALLATILIFMDQQITAVIVNRKDHKLKKGCGYHLDLFVLCILIITCSFLGIPWFVAATVESLTNVSSLKMDSDSAAPGEKPTFLGVREQRVSNILIFATVGLSVFLTPVLSHVPMPVLYGVFLYMGFSALIKMELFERILLVFMPTKYQPEHNYLRQVPLGKVHLFTLIQITCLALLWVIKSIKATAILFPLMLVVMMVVRKLLDYLFSQAELNALDDPLPSSTKNEKIRRLSTRRSSSGNNNLDDALNSCEYKMVENGEV